MDTRLPAVLRPKFTIDGLDVLDPVRLADSIRAVGGQVSQFVGKANSYRTGRGKAAGRGWLLVDFETLRLLSPLIQPVHTLKITDGVRTTAVKNLTIVRADIVDPASSGAGRYLIELADSRWLAPGGALGSENVNVRRVEPVWPTADPRETNLEDDPPEYYYEPAPYAASGGVVSTLELLKGLWTHIDVQELAGDPPDFELTEGWRFSGIPAWDAFWAVLNHVGGIFWLNPDGSGNIGDGRGDTPDDFEEAVSIATRNMRQPATQIALPEFVRVLAHRRDYQWYSDPDQSTAQDLYASQPIFDRRFDTKDLLGTAGENRSDLIHGSEDTLFTTLPYVTTDRRESDLVRDNKDWLVDHMRELARLYVEQIDQADRWIDYDLAGCWPFWPDNFIGGLVFYDYGEGIHTLITTMPRDFNPGMDVKQPAWEQRLAEPGPPDLRKTVPYGREIYITVTAKCVTAKSSSGAVLGVSCPDPEVGDVIPPNGLAEIRVHSGHVNQDDPVLLDWVPRLIRHAWNGTGAPIRIGARGYAKWNYQLQEGGAWVIVSVGSTSEWQELCIDEFAGVECVRDPDLITVSKSDMLRIAEQEVQMTDCIREGTELAETDTRRSMVLGLEGSRVGNSVLWSGIPPVEFQDPEADYPTDPSAKYWTNAPVLSEVSVQCWLKYQQPDKLDYWVGPPFGPDVGGDATLLLPPALPGEPRLLIGQPAHDASADAPGAVTQLQWMYSRGVTGTFSFEAFDPLTGGSRIIIFQISEGLITQVLVDGGPLTPVVTSPEPLFESAPFQIQAVDAVQCPVEFYNPCIVSEQTDDDDEPSPPIVPPITPYIPYMYIPYMPYMDVSIDFSNTDIDFSSTDISWDSL